MNWLLRRFKTVLQTSYRQLSTWTHLYQVLH